MPTFPTAAPRCRSSELLLLLLCVATHGVGAVFDCALAPAAVSAWSLLQCAALRSLYLATEGVGWSHSWQSQPGAAAYCAFTGVTCDGGGAVQSISLPFNSLVGTLPDLSNLSSLTSLNLRGNFLKGRLDSLVGYLPTTLRTLDLSDNFLTGTLPNLASSLSLALSSNLLDGSVVPPALCPAACSWRNAFVCGSGGANAVCAPTCAALPCKRPCPVANLSPASYTLVNSSCGAAAGVNPCGSCLTAVLAPLVANGVSLSDYSTLANCIVEHTADTLIAGALPPVLTGLHNCSNVSSPFPPIYSGSNVSCPGHLPASAFLNAVTPCGRIELACSTCVSALIQPMILAGWMNPPNYQTDGFSLADLELANACSIAHVQELLSLNISLTILYTIASYCVSFRTTPPPPPLSSGGVTAMKPPEVGAVVGGTLGAAAAVGMAALFLWLRRARGRLSGGPDKAASDDEKHGHGLRDSSLGALVDASMSALVDASPVQLRLVDVALLEPPLGHGGQATVYRGRWHGTLVAVKSFSPEPSCSLQGITFSGGPIVSTLVTGSAAHATLLRELTLLQSLRHPNVCAVYGMVLQPPLLVMELAPRGSLSTLLRSQPPPDLDWALRLDIAGGVAAGVAFLHSHSPPIIHFDLKSSNVVLTSELIPKLVDFGISGFVPLVALGGGIGLMGTPLTMAPEIALSQPLTLPTAVDVYGCGCILHDLAHLGFQRAVQTDAELHDSAGSPASSSGLTSSQVEEHSQWSPLQVLVARRAANFAMPIAPHVIPGLAHLISRCLALEPAERPGSDFLRAEILELRGRLSFNEPTADTSSGQ